MMGHMMWLALWLPIANTVQVLTQEMSLGNGETEL
jgi:hypothetical protein